MIARYLIAAMSLLVGATYASGLEGARASFDIAILEQAKDVYMDSILKFLNNLQLPDIGDSKDYLHGNHVSVS